MRKCPYLFHGRVASHYGHRGGTCDISLKLVDLCADLNILNFVLRDRYFCLLAVIESGDVSLTSNSPAATGEKQGILK